MLSSCVRSLAVDLREDKVASGTRDQGLGNGVIEIEIEGGSAETASGSRRWVSRLVGGGGGGHLRWRTGGEVSVKTTCGGVRLRS